jgi:peptidoglycan hydrolase CwlO-like protein
MADKPMNSVAYWRKKVDNAEADKKKYEDKLETVFEKLEKAEGSKAETYRKRYDDLQRNIGEAKEHIKILEGVYYCLHYYFYYSQELH